MLPLKNFKAIHNIAKVMINSKKQYFIEVIPKKLKNTKITHISIKLVDTSSFKTVSFPIMAQIYPQLASDIIHEYIDDRTYLLKNNKGLFRILTEIILNEKFLLIISN